MKLTYKRPGKEDITIIYKQGITRVHYDGPGKRAVIVTQCIVYDGKFVVSVGTVVKHYADEHNEFIGYIEATKKALSLIEDKNLRRSLWSISISSIRENMAQ